MTVTGSIPANQLGRTLMHEHVVVDFIGAEKVSRNRYNPDEVFQIALPHLKRAQALGCQSFVDCTPNWLGRDAGLLRRLSQASGLNIITNTGYYGARQHLFLPSHVKHETTDQLASRWIKEFETGIDGTDIKPGLIKIGVDAGKLSDLNQKIVSAAGITHLKTGLTIAAHTGDGAAAIEQLDLLERRGVNPRAFIWVHAQSEKNTQLHVEAARRGAWIEFDGINRNSLERHVTLLRSMRDSGLLDRVLISQDSGWYHVGEAGGGEFRGYDLLFTLFIPALRAAGFNTREIDQLLVDNPQSALRLNIHARR
jgi:predicted metal-dependent phosphotriesterase family hydrolase